MTEFTTFKEFLQEELRKPIKTVWTKKPVNQVTWDEDEELSAKKVDKFHTALDKLVHQHLGHSSEEDEEISWASGDYRDEEDDRYDQDGNWVDDDEEDDDDWTTKKDHFDRYGPMDDEDEFDEDEEELEDEDVEGELVDDEFADEEEIEGEDEFEDEDDLGDDEFDDEMDDEEPEDPNRQGIIRKVDGAHLVYKRQDEEGTYEELWIYSVGERTHDELDVRRDVLAGTDIPQGKTKSEDNLQQFDMWTSGNVQFLHITGLPN